MINLVYYDKDFLKFACFIKVKLYIKLKLFKVKLFNVRLLFKVKLFY